MGFNGLSHCLGRRASLLRAALAIGVSCCCVALSPFHAVAEEGSGPAPQEVPASESSAQAFDPNDPADRLVSSHVAEYFTLIKRFEAPVGLQGYLLSPVDGALPVVVYTDREGKYLFVGAILDASGANVALEHLRAVQDSQSLPHLFRELSEAGYVAEGGEGLPLLYVVFDPRCPHCADLHEKLRDSVSRGLVSLRWVPVDVLGDEPLAAGLLEASRGPAGSDVVGAYLSSRGHPGGEFEVPDPGEESRQAAADNLRLMRSFGLTATPQILYRAKSGSFQILRGSPSADELEIVINSATALPPDASLEDSADASDS